MIGMSVFDFDGGVNGEYVEQFQVGEYAYYKTPLRPSSGNEVATTLLVNEAAGIFTSTAAGTRGCRGLQDPCVRAGESLCYIAQWSHC